MIVIFAVATTNPGHRASGCIRKNARRRSVRCAHGQGASCHAHATVRVYRTLSAAATAMRRGQLFRFDRIARAIRRYRRQALVPTPPRGWGCRSVRCREHAPGPHAAVVEHGFDAGIVQFAIQRFGGGGRPRRRASVLITHTADPPRRHRLGPEIPRRRGSVRSPRRRCARRRCRSSHRRATALPCSSSTVKPIAPL